MQKNLKAKETKSPPPKCKEKLKSKEDKDPK
jgi:hypothetical protein